MTKTNVIFDRLDGVWQNRIGDGWQDHYGWNFITQPKLNMPGTGDFEMRHDQMHETIKFKKLPGEARNVGVTGKAGFWQALTYEVSITTPAGTDIHHETGHFLLKVEEGGETPEENRGHIIRQATIPRANAMMTTGILEPGTIADAIAQQDTFYSVKPQTDDPKMQDQIDTAYFVMQEKVAKLDGPPDLTTPLVWLETILDDKTDDPDWVFGFRNDDRPSQMAHGQRVEQPVKIGNLLSDFWIGERRVNGRTTDVLQYAQIVNLIFHNIKWPHVALNTLVRQA